MHLGQRFRILVVANISLKSTTDIPGRNIAENVLTPQRRNGLAAIHVTARNSVASAVRCGTESQNVGATMPSVSVAFSCTGILSSAGNGAVLLVVSSFSLPSRSE